MKEPSMEKMTPAPQGNKNPFLRLLTNIENPNHKDVWDLRNHFFEKLKENAKIIELTEDESKKNELTNTNKMILEALGDSMYGMYDKDSMLFQDRLYDLGLPAEKILQNLENAPFRDPAIMKFKEKYLFGESSEDYAQRKFKEIENKKGGEEEDGLEKI